MRFILILALLFPVFVHAQSWEVLQAPASVRNTSKLLAHGNVLFHYEDKTLRSTDAGQSWTEVTGLTDRVTAMVSIGQDVYAMRMQSPPAAMIFLKSSDNGQTWTEVSRPQVTNNGVINDLVYDGSVLLGVSNRDEVFISTDKGANWTIRKYTTSRSESAADGTISSSGIFVISSGGLYRSTDQGVTWLKHGADQWLSGAPRQLVTVGNDVYLIMDFGARRWDNNEGVWYSISNTLPDFVGLFKITLRDIAASGTTLYAVGETFDRKSYVLTSTDRGDNWTQVLELLPEVSSVTRFAIAFSQNKMVIYHNTGKAANSGYYRTTVATVAPPVEPEPPKEPEPPAPPLWPAAFNGVTPDAALWLDLNNIGHLDAANDIIYTCINIQANGQPSSLNGIPRFDMALKIIGKQGDQIQQIQVLRERAFNAGNAVTSSGQLPTCSGVFEATTGRYTDVIKVGDATKRFTFELLSEAALTLKTLDIKDVLPFDGWPSAFAGVAPNPVLQLAQNNIANYFAPENRIYSCVRIQNTNAPADDAGAQRFDIAFDIVNLDQGIIRVNKQRPFNSRNALTAAGEQPSCSGVFATSTKRYEDIISVGPDTFTARFDLVNADTFEFRLVDLIKR